MDDIKKAIYLDVLSSLEERNCNTYICNQLLYYLEDVFDIQSGKQRQELLHELFHEFFALHDGYKYGHNCRWPVDSDQSWFTPYTRHARLSLINFLLTHR